MCFYPLERSGFQNSITGSRSVVHTFAASKRAAISIDRYLKGEDLKIVLDLSSESRVKQQKIENDVALDLKSTLEIRVEVETVPENTLEKFDNKAKRFIDKREIR